MIEPTPDPAIHRLPLPSPTLPPATHTNAYLVGHDRSYIVDPATEGEADRRDLIAAIQARGAPPEAILLTHHHRDHVAAADWLRRELDIPVFAHHRTKALLGDRLSIDHPLAEGDTLPLGPLEPGGDADWLSVLHTPGHASDHLCFATQRAVLIVGDMVASEGTILIQAPDGDMATYLAQLERLRAWSATCLLPAHGAPIESPTEHLDHYIAHRLWREAQVRAALEQHGEGNAWRLTDDAYPNLGATPKGLAAQSCLAHLLKLVADGVADIDPATRADEGPDVRRTRFRRRRR